MKKLSNTSLVSIVSQPIKVVVAVVVDVDDIIVFVVVFMFLQLPLILMLFLLLFFILFLLLLCCCCFLLLLFFFFNQKITLNDTLLIHNTHFMANNQYSSLFREVIIKTSWAKLGQAQLNLELEFDFFRFGLH